MTWLYRMNSTFFLSVFPFRFVTVEPRRQPQISNFGQNLFQLPPAQGPEVVVAAVDDSPGS